MLGRSELRLLFLGLLFLGLLTLGSLILLVPAAIAAEGDSRARYSEMSWDECREQVLSDPHAPMAYECISQNSRMKDWTRMSLALANEILERDPSTCPAMVLRGRSMLFRDSAEALRQYDEAEACLREQGMQDRLGWLHWNRSIAHGVRQEYDEYEEQMDLAQQAERGRPDPRLKAHIGIERSRYAMNRGELAYAWQVGRRVQLDSGFSETPTATKIASHTQMAMVASRLSLLPAGIEQAQRALDLAAPDTYPEARRTALNLIAQMGARASRHGYFSMERAREYALEGERLTGDSPRVIDQVESLFALVRSHDGLEALPYSERLVELTTSSPWCQHMKPTAIGWKADLLLSIDPQVHVDEAVALYDEASAAAVELRNPKAALSKQGAAIRAELRFGDRDRGVARALRALDAVDDFATRPGMASFEELVRNDFAYIYYETIAGLALDDQPTTEDLGLAFTVSERLRNQRDPVDPSDSDPEIAALEQRIARLQFEILANASPDEDVSELEREVESLELQLLELADHGAPRADFEPGSVAPPADILDALTPGEALVSFVLRSRSDDAGLAFVMTAGELSVVTLESPTRIRDAVQFWLGALQRREGGDTTSDSALHARVAAPWLDVLPASVSEVTIIADDSLHGLPFEALRAGSDEPYLSRTLRISYAESATAWFERRKSQREPLEARFLALADPESPTANSMPASWRSAASAASQLGRLPFARSEVQNAAAVFGSANVLRIGRDAGESFIKTANLTEFSALHFATHAVLDTDLPGRSAVFLSADREGEDGLLQAREIAKLSLDGGMVALSACRSADGRVLAGEGSMSLSRAFLDAGADVVVGSLWPIRDEDSSRLMTEFYRRLSTGESVSAALASTKRTLQDAGVPARHWAGVVAIGDANLRFRPPSLLVRVMEWRVSALVTAGLALLLFALGRGRLRREDSVS